MTIDNYTLEGLLSLNPVKFEHLVHTLLTKMGLSTSTTKASGDGGVDIIAINEQPILCGKYVIQCKRYAPRNKVGEPAVGELFGVMMHENANKGILISTSDFSRQARSFSRNKAIELLNGDSILSLLNKHLSSLPTLGIPRQRDWKDEVKDRFHSKFIFSDLTVRDTETGLDWLQDANLSVLPMKWPEANEFIKTNLNDKLFAGYTDWRLPTCDKLCNLCKQNQKPLMIGGDYAGLLNEIGFTNVQKASYWASTSDLKHRGIHLSVNMGFHAFIFGDFGVAKYHVWPVRIGFAHDQVRQSTNGSIIYLLD